MSASYDKSQKISFVYSNLHSVYRKGLQAAKAAELPKNTSGLIRGQVIQSYQRESKASLVNEAPVHSRTLHQRKAIESLQGNLKQLNDLHARLRFMLKELEALSKK